MSVSMHGYRALTAFREETIGRALRGRLLQGDLFDPLQQSFNEDGFVGTLHLVPVDVEVDLSVGDHRDLSLSITWMARLDLKAWPAIYTGPDVEQFEIVTQITVRVTATGAAIVPNFVSVAEGDITVTVQTTGKALLQAFLAPRVRTELVTVLQSGAFAGLEFELEPGPEDVRCTDREVGMGSAAGDADELINGYYVAGQSNTRGTASGLPAFVSADANFEFRLSKAVFDELVAESIADRFMRFQVVASDAKAFKRHGLELTSVPIPLTGKNLLMVAGSKRRNRKHVLFDLDVPATGFHVQLETDADGAFAIMPLGLVPFGAEIAFHGKYQREGSLKLTQFALELMDGHVQLTSVIKKDIACYNDVKVDIQGELHYSIEPTTGALVVKDMNVKLDVPWYIDALEWFGKIAGGLFTGPLVPGLIDAEKDSANAAAAQGVLKSGQKFSDHLPAFSGGGASFFRDGIDIASSGIALYGDLETGWIRHAGRHAKITSYNTAAVRAKVDDHQTLSVDAYTRTVSLSKPSGSVTDLTALVPLQEEFLDVDDRLLAQQNFSQLPFATTLGTTEWVTLPDARDVRLGNVDPPPVFALRTVSGRLCKVRFDVGAHTNYYAVRWVTYDAPEAQALIHGSWNKSSSGTKYTGSFQLKSDDLYLGAGVVVAWSNGGRGDLTVNPQDPTRVAVAFDWDVHEGSNRLDVEFFNIDLTATATDFLGRTVTVTRELVMEDPNYRPDLAELPDLLRVLPDLLVQPRPELERLAAQLRALQQLQNLNG